MAPVAGVPTHEQDAQRNDNDEAEFLSWLHTSGAYFPKLSLSEFSVCVWVCVWVYARALEIGIRLPAQGL